MKFQLNNTQYIETSAAKDISIPMRASPNSVLAWYCEPLKLIPVMTDRFIGDVNKGGAVNFRNLEMNPHAHGTHTECVGHISSEFYSINQCLKEFHFSGVLVTVEPQKIENPEYNTIDNIVTSELLQQVCNDFLNEIKRAEVLIIRTTPNNSDKLTLNHSNTNPTYYSREAIEYINSLEISHLMVDLPSIDREEDNGELIGHHTFWGYPNNIKENKTITELVFIEDEIIDGEYIVNMQITALENDASPSKITLYEILS